MEIFVNGESQHVPENTTVSDLLNTLKLNVSHIAIECNGSIIPKGAHRNTTLHPNDRLEVVHAMGGG